MIPLALNRSFAQTPGTTVRLSPLVRRVLAPNPSPFTFHGTGTYLVGTGRVAVIDPGPADPAHLAALRQALDGERVSHILVTHTHLDHSPAAAPLQARTGAPILGCAPHGAIAAEAGIQVEEGGDRTYRPDRQLADGESVADEGWTLRALATPGHTSNHLCFALEEERALFPGDHVMGWSTTVIVPPDGDMAAYLASLERLTGRAEAVYYPTHGAPIGGPHDALARVPQDFVRTLIAHRRAREGQILARLEAGPQRIPEMVRAIYADVDPRLHAAAALSVHAHLIALVAEGRAAAEGAASLGAVYRQA